jgi:AcrR family transcriptional regulator
VTSQRNTTILRAAAEEVAAVGLRRTSLADVARRAGVSRMTVYREYGDAPSLWRSLLTAEIGEVVAAADQTALASARHGRERLVTAVVEAVTRLSAHALVTRVLELDPELILPFVVDRLGSGQQLAAERIRELLAVGIADGSIRECDGAAAAHLILLLAQSFVFSARIAPIGADPVAVTEELRRMLDGYLGSPATRSSPATPSSLATPSSPAGAGSPAGPPPRMESA